MNNLGICVIYNQTGVLMPYVEYLLAELKRNISDFYIVVNGEMKKEELKKIATYTENIIERENIGYDAAAYADVIVNHIGREKLKQYEEIILSNDTYYGPFEPLAKILDEMRQRNIDFWGLNYIKGSILDYVESYFLVFNNKIISDGFLYGFLEEYRHQVIISVQDVCAFFEVGLFQALKEKGYTFDTFCNTNNYNVYRDPDICLIDYRLPLIKRKCFSDRYYSDTKMQRSLAYVREHTNYDIKYFPHEQVGQLVQKDLKRIREVPPNCSEKQMRDFLKRYKKIYIYGAGLFARKVWAVYHNYFQDFQGFIVSDISAMEQTELYGYPIYQYDKLIANCAMIIGLNFVNTNMICSSIKAGDIFLKLWNC